MTCIAWDGKTLAADKRVTYQGLARTVTKIFRIGDRLVACAGNGAQAMEVVEWIKSGCKPETFPESQRDENQWSTITVIGRNGVEVYERTPYPVKIEDAHYACGSGRDYALAAMHCGKTAQEAVGIACLFETGCGNGIDALELESEINGR